MTPRFPSPMPPPRLTGAGLATVLLLTLAACGGGRGEDGGGAAGADTGTLAITVTGLPAGTNASVVVAGPANFGRALTDSQTITGVAAGTYGIAARPVAAPVPAGATYEPVVPTQSAAVVAGATTGVTVDYDLHECVKYEPTDAGRSIGGTWDAPGLESAKVHQVLAPSDPGGGYVTVTLQAENGIRAGMMVEVLPDAPGSIFNGATSAASHDNPTGIEVVFEVAPSRTYMVSLYAAAATTDVGFPQRFDAQWSYTSRVDCYEPNDTFESAKAIPLGKLIEASFVSGYRDANGIVATSEPTLDFYWFELRRPSAVRITLSDVPATVRPRIWLFDSLRNQVGGTALAPAAGADAVYVSAGPLAAGRYRVQVDTGQSGTAFVRRADTSSRGAEVPPHFRQNYSLVVETLD